MKRQSLEKLMAWKASPRRKPLVLQGARQVGKTWLLKEFARRCYGDSIYASFADSEDMRRIFDGNLDVRRILAGLEVISGKKIIPGNTLIILDEIQDCPNALHALKVFHENAPEQHVVSAGSLLGVAMRRQRLSFPVGQTDFVRLYPMSFYEWLDGVGETAMAEVCRGGDMQLVNALLPRLNEQLKRYLVVGGMPEAVAAFADGGDFREVRRIQEQILSGYANDFAKHIAPSDIPKVISIWRSLPAQLARENRRFAYSLVAKSARAREYENAVEWLELCGLVRRVRRITKPGIPLSSYADEGFFKLYPLDVGLLGAQSRLVPAAVIQGDRLFEEFKGALAEQFALNEMTAAGENELFYWVNETGTGEVDFLVQRPCGVVPVEIKSGINVRARSLAAYRGKYAPKIAVRGSLLEWEDRDGLENLPLAMISRVADISG